MKVDKLSSKMEEVAGLPLKLDLQLFAGDDPEKELDSDPEEPEGLEWESFDSDKPETKEEPEEPENPEVVEPEPEKPKQDHETNKAFQEMRRAKEAAENALKEQDKWTKDNFGHLGITTWKEYQQALEDDRKRQEYADKGIDYDEVRNIAKEEAQNHPSVKAAEVIEQKYAINAEIRALKAAYPDVDISEINDVSDLASTLEKLPNWDQIAPKIQRGYELKDAFELVNRDMILNKRVAAAAQAERNKLNSKNHLKPSAQGSPDDSISVPDDVMQNYERMFSKELRTGKMKREDLVKHYKRSMKG